MRLWWHYLSGVGRMVEGECVMGRYCMFFKLIHRFLKRQRKGRHNGRKEYRRRKEESMKIIVYTDVRTATARKLRRMRQVRMNFVDGYEIVAVLGSSTAGRWEEQGGMVRW